MERVKAVSERVHHLLNTSYSADEISLRRSFLRYMNAFYTLAFTRSSMPRMRVHVSGSIMEGFNPLRMSAMVEEQEYTHPGSPQPTATDLDIICVLQEFSVSDDPQKCKKPGVLKLDISNESPGYGGISASKEDLEVMDEKLFFLGSTSSFVDNRNGRNILNSDRFAGEFCKYLESGGYGNIYGFGNSVARMMGNRTEHSGLPYRQGPAVTNAMLLLFGIGSETKIMEYDFVPALPCPVWPEKMAENWKQRIRQWPSKELEDTIVNTECYLVAVGNSQSKNKELEWRMSFSNAETLLINFWNDAQQKCYIILKALLYTHFKEPKGLSSYHLKTAMFWACERELPEFWHKDNLIGCVRQVLQDLRESLNTKRLLHYFVTENNLFDKIEHGTLRSLSRKIETVLSDLCSYVLSVVPVFTHQVGTTEQALGDPTTDIGRLKGLLQDIVKDWDFVCAHVIYGTKEQMYTGNANTTMENLRRELEKLDLQEALGPNGLNGNGQGMEFLTGLYRQVVVESLAWLLLGEAIWETDHRKQGDLFRETGKFMAMSIETGSQTALVKYAHFLYKAGKYSSAIALCKKIMRVPESNGKGKPVDAPANLSSENLVGQFEHLITERVPDSHVVFKGEDHVTLEEPLYSMVAAAPHFFAMRPCAFAYVVLIMCYNALDDQEGVRLTLKEYSWYAKNRPTKLLQGKELVTVSVLYNHFGYIADAIEHSRKAAACDKRFFQVAEHIQTKGVTPYSTVNGWIRGVMCSTFIAHALYLLGAEWLINITDILIS